MLVRRCARFWCGVSALAGGRANRRAGRTLPGTMGRVLLRLAYLTVTNTFAVLRLPPMSDRDKDVEILTLHHQLAMLQRHLGPRTATFTPADRAFLAALLHPLPRGMLRRLRLRAGTRILAYGEPPALASEAGQLTRIVLVEILADSEPPALGGV
jgi:hypothetical protein